jgi:hypothetical protein
MGLRFRKGVKLFPGIRLNVTKNGLNSLTLGGRGLSYNIGKKGGRGTINKPGTGLSYSHYDAHEAKPTIDRETGEIHEAPRQNGLPWGIIAVIALVVLGVYLLRNPA